MQWGEWGNHSRCVYALAGRGRIALHTEPQCVCIGQAGQDSPAHTCPTPAQACIAFATLLKQCNGISLVHSDTLIPKVYAAGTAAG